MYGMTNFGMLCYDELTEWLLDADFIQYQYQMSIYYKYAPYGTKNVVSSYVDDFVYWYISESLGKWFVDNLVKNFHVKFLGYSLVNFSTFSSLLDASYLVKIISDGKLVL